MTDYIDREAVMRKFAYRVRRSNNSDFAQTPTWNQAVQIVEDSPAADVAPVVHGKWINGRCSVCGEFIPTDNARDCITEDEVRYCPNCGAKMDGEESDGKELMKQAADAIEELADRNVGKWIPVTERLPKNNVHVLLACKCGCGSYVCDGFHTEKYSTPTQFYEDIDADYNEETDEYYFPKGWWEVIKNWDDYSCVAIEDKVTHWMPLPEPPKEDEVGE